MSGGTPPRLKIACPHCRQKLDISELEPFSRIDCPACGVEIIVPRPFGELMLEEPLAEREPTAVYRALDLTLDREVAVKVLHAPGPEGASVRREFLERARRAAAVNHAHIVPIYSCGEVEGAPYLVMQFMADGTLADKIRPGGAVDIRWAVDVIVGVAQGLQAARKYGLLHGDVRPKNILFDADGQVKISDFGLFPPSLRGEPCDTGILERWGARPYASPESHGAAVRDVRSDIYGLGATFYHLLTGYAPGAGPPGVSEKADAIPPPRELNERIPQALSACVMRMMAPAPEQRPPDYTGVIDALKGLSRRSAKAARPATFGGRKSRGESGDTRKVKSGNRGTLTVRNTAAGAARRRSSPAAAGSWGWVNAALALAGLVLLGLFGMMFRRHLDSSTTPPSAAAESAGVSAIPTGTAPATSVSADIPGRAEARPGSARSVPAAADPAPPGDDVPGAVAGGGRDTGSTEPGGPAASASRKAPPGSNRRSAKNHRSRKRRASARAARPRPRPPGLDFMAVRDQLKDYLAALPPEERRLERERIGLISDSRKYLLQLMRYMPFEPAPGHPIRLRDGRTLQGSVPYCNDKEIAVRLRGRRSKLRRLSWDELAFSQFVDFFEFYIQTRCDQGGKGGSAALTPEQKREIGDDCIRLALLCDWYGDQAGRDRNARRALRFVPEKRALLKRLLPGMEG